MQYCYTAFWNGRDRSAQELMAGDGLAMWKSPISESQLDVQQRNKCTNFAPSVTYAPLGICHRGVCRFRTSYSAWSIVTMKTSATAR